MKNINISKVVIASLLSLSTASAFADATLDVSATVPAVCYFSSPNYTLDFGSLDPASSADAQASVDVTYWCTAGMTATLQADNGLSESGGVRHLSRGGVDTIAYSLTLPAGNVATNGPSSPNTAAISGTILNADYKNTHWGAYSDVVALTVFGE